MNTQDAFRTIDFALFNQTEIGLESKLAWTNEAGALLCNMHPWKWLERSTGAISLVAGQEYVDLPADFGRLIGDPWQITGLASPLQARTLNELNGIRSSGATSSVVYAYAITYPAFTTAAEPGRARMEIAPTPAANDTNAIRIFYYADWVDAEDDSDYLDVRPFMVPLYKLVLSELARGYVQPDDGTAHQRMEQVRASMIFRDACQRDGGAQSSLGPMRGGAIDMETTAGGAYTGLFMGGRIVGP